jgi:hypothetical protein
MYSLCLCCSWQNACRFWSKFLLREFPRENPRLLRKEAATGPSRCFFSPSFSCKYHVQQIKHSEIKKDANKLISRETSKPWNRLIIRVGRESAILHIMGTGVQISNRRQANLTCALWFLLVATIASLQMLSSSSCHSMLYNTELLTASLSYAKGTP